MKRKYRQGPRRPRPRKRFLCDPKNPSMSKKRMWDIFLDHEELEQELQAEAELAYRDADWSEVLEESYRLIWQEV